MRRYAYEEVVAQDLTDLVDWEVVLADVYAVGVDQPGDVRSVVDYEKSVVRGRSGAKLPSRLEQIAIIESLFAELYDIDSDFQSRLEDIVGFVSRHTVGPEKVESSRL